MPGLIYQEIKKNIMVKGANKANSKGQNQWLKAALNNRGLISHHISKAMRGPINMAEVITQHILDID